MSNSVKAPSCSAGIRSTKLAFTLVEMLVVMAVIIAIISLAAPLIKGVVTGRNVTNALDTITSYFEYARTQAMTQNTYVAVGFYQKTGSDDLQLNSVRAVNGVFAPDFVTHPTLTLDSTMSFLPFGNTVHFSNVKLVPALNSSDATNQISNQFYNKLQQAKVLPPAGTNDVQDCCAVASKLSFLVGTPTNGTTFSQAVIVFTPQGEVLYFPDNGSPATSVTAATPFYSQLFIGMRACRNGAPVATDPNSAGLTLDGGAGNVVPYRL